MFSLAFEAAKFGLVVAVGGVIWGGSTVLGNLGMRAGLKLITGKDPGAQVDTIADKMANAVENAGKSIAGGIKDAIAGKIGGDASAAA